MPHHPDVARSPTQRRKRSGRRWPDRAQLRTVWWTVRSLGAIRRQLRDRAVDQLEHPSVPRVVATRRSIGVVRLVSRLYGASCLEDAVVRQAFWAAAGRRHDLVIGVTAPASGFRAHAWLDGDRDHGGFVELARHEAPPAQRPRLPDFVVIGAPKAGSTSLWGYLRAHPEVFMCSPKEPEFFTENWAQGPTWYAELFAAAEDAVVVGEASVRYATPRAASREVPERMAAVIPDAKLVYVVRHPVDRMVSQWQHNRRLHAEPLPLAEALVTPRYTETSRYAAQLDRFAAYFPSERIHVVVAERLRADPEAELGRLFGFLGVDPTPDLRPQGWNRVEDLREPRAWMHAALRHLALRVAYRAARRRTPAVLLPAIQRVTRRPATRTVLSEGARRAASRQFADDVRALRGYVEGPFDGWGIG